MNFNEWWASDDAVGLNAEDPKEMAEAAWYDGRLLLLEGANKAWEKHAKSKQFKKALKVLKPTEAQLKMLRESWILNHIVNGIRLD